MRHVEASQIRPIPATQTLVGRFVLLFLALLVASCSSGGDTPQQSPPPPGDDASLSSLTLSSVDLQPSFNTSVTEYTASVGFAAKSTQVTATAADTNAAVSVNGFAIASGAASDPIALDEGGNTITVNVTAEDGSTTQTYTVDVTRQSASEFAQSAYLQASNVTDYDQLGGAVALSDDGATLVVGAFNEDSAATGVNGNEDDDSVARSGAAYVFTRDSDGNWTQQAYIKASNTDELDDFGVSVALSGDGTTFVVGAPGEESAATGVNGDEIDNSAGGAGAAYVFARDTGGVWTQQAYVKASNTDTYDNFGNAVALSDDGTTLVVGAPYEDSATTGVNGDETDNSAWAAGAAYVFTRDDGGTWTQQAYIKASNTDEVDSFGTVVALSGDGATLVVGAPRESSAATGINGDETDNSTSSGAAYVFTRDSGGIWTQQAYLKASNTDRGDAFGRSVSLSDDGMTIAVGAPGERSAATGVNGDQMDNSLWVAGAAYVFSRGSTSIWTQQAYIKASNTEGGDSFGYFEDVDFTEPWPCIALSDDGSMLAVGAMGEDSAATGVNGHEGNGAPGSGAAYVFTRDSMGSWTQRAYVKASDSRLPEWFRSPALSGDGTTLAVGAPGDDDATTVVNANIIEVVPVNYNSGAVYVFEL